MQLLTNHVVFHKSLIVVLNQAELYTKDMYSVQLKNISVVLCCMMEKLSQEELMPFHFAIFTAVRRHLGNKCTKPFNKHTDIIIVIIKKFFLL